MFDTWTCHVCGKERPDAYISVRTIDMSSEYKLPVGTVKQNVRYCNDNFDCAQGSRTKSLLKRRK